MIHSSIYKIEKPQSENIEYVVRTVINSFSYNTKRVRARSFIKFTDKNVEYHNFSSIFLI